MRVEGAAVLVMPATAAEQANWWKIAPDWRGTILVA